MNFVKTDLPYSERTNDLQIAGQSGWLGIFIMRLLSGDWVNWLKLRFSVGNPGNQNFSAYKAYTTYVYNTNLQNAFGMGANVSGFGNPDLKWQKTMDYNLGIGFDCVE